MKATVSYYLFSDLFTVASGQAVEENTVDAAPWLSEGTASNCYRFEQPVPIPSYLIAFASGELAKSQIGPRSHVICEPENIKDYQWELEADTENFIQALESIVGAKYEWGTYDVLCLPPSFPYGGMENPNVTFATPTICSRDRQNVDVIAHEISHSFSGNLVTNASWESFFLNEGWTTYLERRIQAKIHGSDAHRDFSAIIGWKALVDSVDGYGHDHEFTKLVPKLDGLDPDDAFSSIPYEKGYVFLTALETLLGKDRWNKFIPHYFKTWANKSLDAFEFRETLLEFFSFDTEASKLLQDFDWQTWFYAPGLPPKPHFDDSLAKVCYELVSKWKNRSFTPSPQDIQGWSANQGVVFLEALQSDKPTIPAADVKLLGDTYGFAKSYNVELVSRYLCLAL